MGTPTTDAVSQSGTLGGPAARRTWGEAARAYLQPKMLAMLLLGFGSGLPFMMFFSKLSRWLSEVGIDKSTIGFFYYLGLVYGLKFLWSPVVDRVRIPVLGRVLGQRRSWMMVAVVGTIVGMAVISGADPQPGVEGSLIPILVGAAVLTFSGATLDISVDAWRIESGTNDEQANLAAVYQLGYRFAIMAAGYSLLLAEWVSWRATYLTTAALMAAVAVVILFIREPSATVRRQASGLAQAFRINVIEPFWDLFRRIGGWFVPVLLLVMAYRLSDFTMGVMTQPLYSDLGYTKVQVGLIQGTFGPWPLIAGAFIGGILCVRYGLMKVLLLGAVLTIVTNGAFAWLATQEGAVTSHLLVTVLADNIAAGVVGTVFIAYLSSLASREFAATQYALLSSLYALPAKALAGQSGVAYEWLGPVEFFLATALLGIPAVLLIAWIWRFGSPIARGEDPAKQMTSPTESADADSPPTGVVA